MVEVNEYTVRGVIELLKFIGVVLAPIVIGGVVSAVFERPKDGGKEPCNER